MKKIIFVIVNIALMLSLGTPAFAVSNSWGVDAGGNWIDAANWSGGVNVPGIAGGTTSTDTATFTTSVTAFRTITLDSGRNVRFISFNLSSNSGYRLVGGPLNLTNGGGIVNDGSNNNANTISSAIQLQGNGGTSTFTSNNGGGGLEIVISGGVTGVSANGSTTTLTLNGTSTRTGGGAGSKISGIIGDGSVGGNLAVTKNDAGIWALTGVNTYTGVTTLSGGTLIVATIGDGGVAGNLGQASAAATNLVFDGGILKYTGATASTNRNFTINTGKTATIDVDVNANNLTLSGASTVTNGALTKAGAGTLTLSGANTYTGATTLSNGTLQIGVDSVGSVGSITSSALGTGALAINGGTISSDSTTARTLLNAVTFGGDVALGNATNNGKLTFSAAANLGGATRTLTTASDAQFDGVISNGGLTKAGAATLTLSGANTYTGATTLSNGTLQIGVDSVGSVGSITSSALGTGALAINGGTISSDSTTARTLLNAVTFGGDVALGNATNNGKLTFSAAANLGGATRTLTTASDAEFGGVISNGGLTKAGAGTLTLSGDNTYTSGTTVSAGKLLLDRGTSFGNDYFASSGIAIASGATFEINQTGNTSRYSNITKTVTGAGTFSKTGAGEINLANDSTSITTFNQSAGGLINVQAGTLSYFNTHADNKGSLTIATGATATLDNAQGAPGYFDALNGGGNLSYATGSARTITLGTANGGGTFSGILSNGGSASVSLTKTGSGTQIFSGNNTYTGATSITGGILQLGAAGALGNGTNNTSGVTVSNLAALDLGGITPTATVALNLNGTTATGTVGALTNSSGTAASYNGAVTLQTASSIGSSNGNITLGGAVSGANGLTKVGTDTLILTGASNGSTTTTISDGTLQIGTGGATGALGSGLVTDNGNLTINRNNAFTIGSANAISGTGSFTQAGSGTTTLSGTNTYTGDTNINAGTLVVDGSIATSLLTSVNSGGILQGSGTTGAVSINSGGTLSPGDSPGTLTSAGGATYAGGGTYLWQINNATGAAGNPTGWDLHNITGGALNISATSGSKFTIDITGLNAGNTSGSVVNFNKFTNYTWKIASATGGVTDFAANKFNLLTTNFTNNNSITGIKSNGFFSIGTLGNDLQLIYTAAVSATNYASDANPGDTNARNVGTVLDNITNPSADMTNVLNTMSGLSRAQVAAALDTMVPQVDAGVVNTDRESLNNFTGVSIDRVEKAHTEVQSKHSARSGVSSGEAGKLDGLWAKGYGSYLNQGTRGGIAGYNAWNAGTALGVDRRFTDALTFGISGGYAYGNVNSDANGANTTINSAQTTLYGGYQDQKRPYFVDTAVSFAYNWYAGRRNINVGNVILRTANGSYDGQQYGAYLGGGYKFKFADAIEVTPLVSLQYNNLQINSYNETGAGALNLNAGTQNYNQLQSGLGGRIATTLSSQWGKVTPELHSKWLYDFFGDPFAVTSTFNGGGADFGANGAKPAINSFNVGGELKLDLRDEIAVTGKIDAQLRQDFSGVFGSFTVRF